MERVAARAHTGKAAIYRRWPNRAELVVDACKVHGIHDDDLPDTGALRTDMIALLRQVSVKMASPFGSIVRGLLAELPRHPDFARLVRERLHTVGPSTVRVILERAVERGEVERWIIGSRRATVATDLIRNEFLLFGAPVADRIITEIVDDVYLPLVLSPAPAPADSAQRRGPD